MRIFARRSHICSFLAFLLLAGILLVSIFRPAHHTAGAFLYQGGSLAGGGAFLRESGAGNPLPEAVKEEQSSSSLLLSESACFFSSKSGFRSLFSWETNMKKAVIFSTAIASIQSVAHSCAQILLNPATYTHQYILSYIQAQLYR